MTFRGTHLYSNGPEIQGVFGVTSLQLTTVAHIVSYLDGDVASLSRLCRTSRSLYYMTVPHLWRSVFLKSYNSIRYKDDLPEGFGSASPFSMGLNALVTRNVSSFVRSLALEGGFGDSDQSQYSRAGRVSESGMILNIAVCAALEKCHHLEQFKWELDTRIEPNVYSALTRLSGLQELWLKFPNTRTPHPVSEIPPLPNLSTFTVTNYDPLCHPDDISTLLLHADKLHTLRLHFSPRMRDQGESSVHLNQFFRKNALAKKRLKIKTMGVYNLLASADVVDCLQAIDSTTCEHFTAINSCGLDEDVLRATSNATYFIERTWLVPLDVVEKPKPKSLRLDQLSKSHTRELSQCAGVIEYLYLINARHRPEGTNSIEHSTPSSAECSPRPNSANWNASIGNNSSKSARGTPTPNTNLRDLYVDTICNVCGPTLKHLIFPSRWPLTQVMLARLVRSAPNLTQLSASIVTANCDIAQLLVPSLTKLWAFRLQYPTQPGEEGRKMQLLFDQIEKMPEALLQEWLSTHFSGPSSDGASREMPRLRYLAIGPMVWEIGRMYEETVKVPIQKGSEDASSNVDPEGQAWREEIICKRSITKITEDDVKDVAIWKMDSLDVI